MIGISLLGLSIQPMATAAEPCTAPPAEPRPNIVVIMTDDLDAGLLKKLESLNQPNGASVIPHIKANLVDQGVTFTSSYVTNSLCCPSRATFLTGQYSHNTHVLTNEESQGGIVKFNDTKALPTWLKNQGCYRTGFVGKYLNGYGYMDIATASPLQPGVPLPGPDGKLTI